MTTSFIRLVAVRPYSAADVEVSAPDIIMSDLGKYHGPGDGIRRNDAKPLPDRHQVTTRARPVYAT